jgi:hypothetical protein
VVKKQCGCHRSDAPEELTEQGVFFVFICRLILVSCTTASWAGVCSFFRFAVLLLPADPMPNSSMVSASVGIGGNISR